jgi:negative regulator of sigma E activity
MNADFTIEELDSMHISMVTRERVIREQWISIAKDDNEKQSMLKEADFLKELQKKVCEATLNKRYNIDFSPSVLKVET